MNEGPFFMGYTVLKAKIDAESERLRRSSWRWLWFLRFVWPLSLIGNVYVFSQNIALGGCFHGLLAGVNATMISLSVCGIIWTWFVWPLMPWMTK